MKQTLLALMLAIGLSIIGGCGSTTNNPGDGVVTITGEGTVHQGVGPECGDVWHVATAQGVMLWPVADPALRVEGLRVRFTARERTDAVSICMAGKNVEFTLLERL